MTLDELAASKQGAGHSIFSPSGAHRWSACLGSLVACALTDDTAGRDAAEGTVAHAMADQWLRSGLRPARRTVVEDGYEIEVTDEMLAYVEQYVDWVQDAPGHHYFEQSVDFSSIMPIAGQTGTADHFACTRGTLTITDLKYGKGLRVDAENNPQAQLYALGVFYEWDWFYDFQTIVIRVCQPRLDHFDTWTITRDELMTFAGWISERAREAWVVDAPRAPGEKQCKFCSVKRDCPAHLAWLQQLGDDLADDVFGAEGMTAAIVQQTDPLAEQIVLPEMTVEAWCAILPMRGAIEAWFTAGEAKVFAAAHNGTPTPGYKIVEGRSNRDWIDPEKAEARMLEVGMTETHTRKLKSPNQAEEQLQGQTSMGKKAARDVFESFTERKPGVLSLVRSTDKREAVPSYGDVFGESHG